MNTTTKTRMSMKKKLTTFGFLTAILFIFFLFLLPYETKAQTAPTITSFTFSPSPVLSGGTAQISFVCSSDTTSSKLWLKSGSQERVIYEGTFSSRNNISTGALSESVGHSVLLYCWGASGAADSRSIPLTCDRPDRILINGVCSPIPDTHPADFPRVTSINSSRNPIDLATTGDHSATISWTSSNATSCNLTTTGWMSSKTGTNDYDVIAPTQNGEYIYTVRCRNNNGDVSDPRSEVQTVYTTDTSNRIFNSGPQTWWNWPSSTSGYDRFEWDVTPLVEPTAPDAYFYSHQFSLNGGAGAYAGIQVMDANPRRKTVLFSVWDSIGSENPTPGGRSGEFGGEGVGYSVGIDYPWNVGTSYRLRVARTTGTSGGNWWGAWIKNNSTGSETYIGKIKVSSSWGGLSNSSVSWTERFGGPTGTCSDIHLSDVLFTNFLANGSISPISNSNAISTPQLDSNKICSGTYAVNVQNGSRQQIGSSQAPPEYNPSPTLTASLKPLDSQKLSDILATKTLTVGDPALLYWQSQNTSACHYSNDTSIIGSSPFYIGTAQNSSALFNGGSSFFQNLSVTCEGTNGGSVTKTVGLTWNKKLQPTNAFAVGDRVEITKDTSIPAVGGLTVYPPTMMSENRTKGSTGTIKTATPTAADSKWWWGVQFEDKTLGFVPDDSLKAYVAPVASLVAPKCVVDPSCQAGFTGAYPNCVGPSSCPVNYTGTYPNCIAPSSCPSGYTGTYPNCVAPSSCPTGFTGAYPNCVGPSSCPAGYSGTYPNCVAPRVNTCPASYTGTYPDCVGPTSCPVNYTGTYPDCVANLIKVSSCPSGYTGVFPDCVGPTVCPAGNTGTYPNCVAPRVNTCPANYTGTYPNCVGPTACPTGTRGTYPNCAVIDTFVCPTGFTGTYPNCVADVIPGRTCPSGFIGAYPDCRGTTVGPSSCPSGFVGAYPDCHGTVGPSTCPLGYTGVYPVCVGPASSTVCPTGFTGAYPNCVGPSSCPAGYSGTYPNCAASVSVTGTGCSRNVRDGVCSNGETAATCPADCAIIPVEISVFKATPNPVVYSSKTGLTWNAPGATRCIIAGKKVKDNTQTYRFPETGVANPSGSADSSKLTENTNFTLDCVNNRGGHDINTILVKVLNPSFREF